MLSIEGHLTVWERYADGSRRKVSDRKNQITTLHLTNLAELVTQKVGITPVELAIHSMWIEASDSALPAAASSDTAPAGIVVKKGVFDDADIDVDIGGTPGLVEFRQTLESGEGNGQTIRAAGLYTQGDETDHSLVSDSDPQSSNVRLVARQVFDGVPKSSAIALDFQWRVQYKIAS